MEEAKIFFAVEEMPEFPGGETELRKFIASNIRYPEIAKENGSQGKVYIFFVINAEGGVEQIEIKRSLDPFLDKEAIRVIQSMPKWSPGKQSGVPVKVAFTIPINFQLQ
jgi:periplasmic protein TonB